MFHFVFYRAIRDVLSYPLIIATLVMLLAVCATANEFYSYAFEKQYVCQITKEMIEKTPPWLDKFDSPPLPPRKALAIAEKMADELVGTKEGFKRELVCICLRPIEDGWVWEIRFKWSPPNAATTGIQDYLNVMVLMDGTAVQPRIADRDEDVPLFSNRLKGEGNPEQ